MKYFVNVLVDVLGAVLSGSRRIAAYRGSDHVCLVCWEGSRGLDR